MIKKGKGPIISKLRIIEIIEAEIQLLMRMTVNQRNKYTIKNDQRIAKSNYGSRPNYLIKDAILEKQLVCNNSMSSEKQTIHNITDLELCYDRQLPKIELIV